MSWSPWCIGLVILLIVLLMTCWAQLLVWKAWADRYRAWVARNCNCPQPGGDPEPTQPKWP
jgi:hypothetical protein